MISYIGGTAEAKSNSVECVAGLRTDAKHMHLSCQ